MTMTIPSTDSYGADTFAEPKSFALLDAALGWPEKLTIPASVLDALDVLNKVVAMPLPSRPLPTPAELLDAEHGDNALDAAVVEALVAPKRAAVRKQVAAFAADELVVAIGANIEAIWSAIDGSFGAAFAKLATVDTALPARLSAVEAARMTAQTRKEIEVAEKINAVMDAAGRLAPVVVPYQYGNAENVAYTMLRYVTFPDQSTYEKWKTGVHFKDDVPLDGSSLMAWSAKCGCVASIARSHAIRESRWAALHGEPSGKPIIEGRSRSFTAQPDEPDDALSNVRSRT